MVRKAGAKMKVASVKTVLDASNGGTFPVTGQLDYDALIREHGAVTVRKGHTPIGVVAEKSPTWAWYVGALGSVKWLVGTEDLIGRKPGDPPWLAKTTNGLTIEDVEVILLQGDWGLIGEHIWKSKSVSLILKAPKAHLGNRGSRGEKHRRKRRRLNATGAIPASWKVGSIYLEHKDLGGVTSGGFQVEWASPREAPEVHFVYPPGLSINLGQVVNRKLKGRPTGAPTPNQWNSSMGLLRWRHRFQEVVVPYTYRANVWTSRELCPQELCEVLDFPAERVKGLNPTQVYDLTREQVPGKVLGACLWFLGKDKEQGPTEDAPEGKRRLSLVDSSPFKRARTMRIPDQVQQVYEGIGPDEVSSTPNLVIKEPTLSSDSAPGYGNEVERKEDRAGTATDKATKADDAAVPVFLWNDRIQKGLENIWSSDTTLDGTRPLDFGNEADQLRFRCALNKLRHGCLCYWKRKVKADFEKWYQLKGKSHPHAKQVWIDGQAAVSKASQASWWNWDKGSSIFFWRWPADYQEIVRVGLAPMFDTEAPTNRDQQPAYECEEVRAKVKKKLDNVLMKGYIELTDIKLVEAMMFMFHVPKGEADIRMVYDGTKSGLNDSLFSYWFALPTVNSMVRWVVAGSWLADNDYGEQFLNFPLHPNIRKLCGVDLTQLYPEKCEDKDSTVTGAWMRSAMGLKTSPYNAVQGSQRAKRIILGDPRDPLNPFHWATIKLNLPGTEHYNPSEPWIQKMRADGLAAAEIVQYVDDVRIIAPTEELAWLCSSTMGKGLSFLGLQDAARKRRKPSQTPGAWAGATVSSEGDVVKKGVTKERWEKVKLKVRWIADQIGLSDSFSPGDYGDLNDRRDESGECPHGCIHYKTMESYVGFLVYVSMTYTSMVPYLKGIYLTLNSWRDGRDVEGWPDAEMKRLFDEGREKVKHREGPELRSKKGHPVWSKAVPRLKDDLIALMRLTRYEDPPMIPVRPTNSEACYVVGDASGAGFGSSSYNARSKVVEAEYGTWVSTVTNDRSSNFREAANLAGRIKRMLEEQKIPRGSEVFVFTDNSCAESTMYKGASRSKLLHNMVLDLRAMEMAGDIIVRFVWISGKRMIWQGGDGLSRGDFTSGAMAGGAFLKYLPLHENAIQRHPDLEKELLEWVPKRTRGTKWKLAKVEDWFHEVFLDPEGSWIWAPPPVLAKVAVEQLCEAKHLFPKSKHVFVCPSIMTGVWRKQLLKVADCQFSLINGCKLWPEDMYEPLTVALLCPPLFQSPWKAGRSPLMEIWKEKVCSLSWNDAKLFRSSMCKFWLQGQWD